MNVATARAAADGATSEVYSGDEASEPSTRISIIRHVKEDGKK